MQEGARSGQEGSGGFRRGHGGPYARPVSANLGQAGLDPVQVAFAGVLGQRALLRAGRVSALDVLELSLSRIARFDGALGAFRTLLEGSARAEAAAADAALAVGDDRPLLGIPVAVKDNLPVVGTAPSHGTGSREPAATADAEVVRRLRAAGAVIVGTTRLPELALWPFTESETFGATRNPWSTDHTPGGSSGGSAAAVAAGLVAAAQASDGGGSIRIPAACCHLVGLKGSRGRIPLTPYDDHWYGMSVFGAVTRTVADQALLLDVLSESTGHTTDLRYLPRPLRIAWSVKGGVPASLHAEVIRGLQDVLAVLQQQGHTLVEADPSYAGVQDSFVVRFARGAADDLAGLAEPSKTERRTRVVAGLGRRLPDRALARARRRGDAAAARLATLPAGADVLITPTLPQPPLRIGAMTGLRAIALAGRVASYTAPWNVTGQPALSVPSGLTPQGLPLAVQLVGRPGDDGLLLAIGAQLEEVLRWPDRRPPQD